MNSRIKNICILIILITFLLIVYFIPVTCLFYQVTGIYCPACGMTRAFLLILHSDFILATYYNILSIPLFIFILYSVLRLIIDIVKNKFEYVPKLLHILSNKTILIFLFICIMISFVFNNLK